MKKIWCSDTNLWVYWSALIKEMLTSSCVVPCQSLFAIAIIYAPLVGLKRKVKSKYQQWETNATSDTSTTEEDRGSSPQSLFSPLTTVQCFSGVCSFFADLYRELWYKPSDRTSYASDSSLNFFSASSLFSGFLSGCHLRASLLYLNEERGKDDGCWVRLDWNI